ncbi:MAG: FAD-binding domain [Bradyrhizobium sp.]|nr:FAD-binding domain [Pseudomonadota bacterium]MDE2472551.1 FAD-binding domain [Bradyrhizobium sp.]
MRSVLISGAGIAGPTLAYWLKVAGYKPTLVERAPVLRHGGYVIDFWGLGYDLAKRMGLLDEMNRIGYHVREMRIVNDQGRSVARFGTDVLSDLTAGRYVTLGRSDLSRLLFEKSNGQIESIFGDTIVCLEEQPDFVRVQFEHARERRFGLVIGADGLHSRVRSLVFGPQARFEQHLGYAVAAFEVPGYRPRDENVYCMYGQPGRMLGRFTLRNNRTLFLFVFVATTEQMPGTIDEQKALLRDLYRYGGWECTKVLYELDRTDELYFDSVSQIRMPHWSRGRIALVGDAAFCVSLLAGQGSVLAMISSYVLAGELAAACGDHQRAFTRYETLLRTYIAGKQLAAERFAGAFAPKTRLGLSFRNLVVKAFAFPGLASLVLGRDIADSMELPQYRWPGATSREPLDS